MLRRDERGATAVIVAGSLILLFGIAAIAVDYTNALNQRRQDVGSADTAALGGILEAQITTNVNALQAAVNEAKQIAQTNNGAAISNADWSNCTDPEALARPSTLGILGITDGSPCISFDETFSTMRVVIPEQVTEAAFGGVIGVNEIRTSAAAEASINTSVGGGAFPTGVYSGAAAGDEFCLKNPPSGASTADEICGGSTAGNFGPFLPYFYEPGPRYCRSGQQSAELVHVIANGMDHLLGTAPSAPGNRLNGAWCSGPGSVAGPAFPNRVGGSNGAGPSELTGGYLGSSPLGRLRQGTVDSGMRVFGAAITNNPLWIYIDDSLAGMPPACNTIRSLPADPGASDFDAIGIGPAEPWQDAQALLQTCLSNANSRIFTSSIINDPRFIVVPRFFQPGPGSSASVIYDIRRFEPAYVHAIVTKEGTGNYSCTSEIDQSPGEFCRHIPGMDGAISRGGGGGGGSVGSAQISSSSALLLKCAHLPSELCSAVGSGGPGSRSFFVSVELTR